MQQRAQTPWKKSSRPIFLWHRRKLFCRAAPSTVCSSTECRRRFRGETLITWGTHCLLAFQNLQPSEKSRRRRPIFCFYSAFAFKFNCVPLQEDDTHKRGRCRSVEREREGASFSHGLNWESEQGCLDGWEKIKVVTAWSRAGVIIMIAFSHSKNFLLIGTSLRISKSDF